MGLKEKIKAARENKSITQDELAKLSGVSIQSIKRYESLENSNITLDNLQKIAQALGVDTNFFVSTNIVSQMSPNHKDVVSQSDSTTHTPHQKSSIIQIPIYDDVVASAGSGVINDEYPTQSVGIDKGFLRTHFGLSSFLGLSIITAKGDSMSPTIPENCQLLVQKSVPKEGQICVVRIDYELYVKRLQKLPKYRLISDNKSYENIELEGREYDIVGVVVGFFKRMI